MTKERSENRFDVLVIGAGPAGSTAAGALASSGWKVGLLDENARIGEQVNCSGIVGVEAFERYRLPESLVRHTMGRIEFCSPGGLRFGFDAGRPLAHAVLRNQLDSHLAERARTAGARLLLNHRVCTVTNVFGGLSVAAQSRGRGSGPDRRLRARALVVATGAGVPLLGKLGFDRLPGRLLGVQVEVDLTATQVEVYLGRRCAPEGFAWIVPLGNGRAKVGLLCQRDGPQTLSRFLARPDIAARIRGSRGPIRCSLLPLGFLPKSYADRILVVGEAAGHIKATTCGGIYYAMRTAEQAAEVLDQSLREDRLDAERMSLYEKRWRELLEDEIEMGLKLRRSFKLMNDWSIERLMSLAQKDGIHRLIREKANFDWHRDLIDAVFRHATVGRILGAA